MSVNPRSVYAPDTAVYVDLNSKDAGKAARSLAQMQGRFSGRKVVFFKEGENFFAVPDEERPNLFVKQLGRRRDPKKPSAHYANDEAGGKLADLFPTRGAHLQSKMNESWCLFSVKKAIDSQEFEPVIADQLSEHMDTLEAEFNRQLNPHLEQIAQESESMDGDDGVSSEDRRANAYGVPVHQQLIRLHEEFKLARQEGRLNGQVLTELSQQIDDIQLRFWMKMSPLIDQDRGIQAADNQATSQGQWLEKAGGSNTEIRRIEKAGLAGDAGCAASSRWIGPARGLVSALVRLATEHNNSCRQLRSRIDKDRGRVESVDLRRRAAEGRDRIALINEFDQLHYRASSLQLSQPVDYDEQVKKLREIADEAVALRECLDAEDLSKNDAMQRARANLHKTEMVEDQRGYTRVFLNLNGRLRHHKNNWLSDPGSIFPQEDRQMLFEEVEHIERKLDRCMKVSDVEERATRLENIADDVEMLNTVELTGPRAKANKIMTFFWNRHLQRSTDLLGKVISGLQQKAQAEVERGGVASGFYRDAFSEEASQLKRELSTLEPSLGHQQWSDRLVEITRRCEDLNSSLPGDSFDVKARDRVTNSYMFRHRHENQDIVVTHPAASQDADE